MCLHDTIITAVLTIEPSLHAAYLGCIESLNSNTINCHNKNIEYLKGQGKGRERGGLFLKIHNQCIH